MVVVILYSTLHTTAKCNECSYSFMSTVMTFYIGCVPSTYIYIHIFTSTYTTVMTTFNEQQLQLL